MGSIDRHVHVVEDDEMVRDSTALLLRLQGFKVEAWASGTTFLRDVESHRPGCVLLDLCMPDISGIEVQEALLTRMPSMQVVILTGHGDICAAIRAIRAGAVDFLEKPVDKASLLAAIDAAHRRLLDLNVGMRSAGEARAVLARLTGREADVLEGLSRGLSNKGIAGDLAISPRTVEVHRANIMAKLGARSLSQALRVAFTAGLGDDRP